MARAQSLLNSWHILYEELANQTDWALEVLWNKPVPQQLFCISVVILSSYLWISALIAYVANQLLQIAYGINLFLGIIYGANQILGIVYGINLFL